MNINDIVSLAGWAFISWALGFGMGLLVSTFRKYMETL